MEGANEPVADLREEWLERLRPENHALLFEELHRFPELCDACTPPGFDLEPFEDSYLGAGSGEIVGQLSGRLVPDSVPKSPEVGYVDVEFVTADRLLAIHTLDIPPAYQAGGLGRFVIAQLAVLGDRLSLDAIELEAGKVGRWAWMRCGFDFMDERARHTVVAAAQEFAERLGRQIDLSDIEHSWDFLDLDGSIDPSEIRAVGGPEISPAGERIPIAKALLLGPHVNANPWFGRLSLDRGSQGRVRLDNYVLTNGDAG